MDKRINLLKTNIFEIILFILLINSSLSYLAFKFPYAFKLNNKNIFVIHSLGITICDETFTETIKRVLTFSDSEKITTDRALSKIASVQEDEYIICLINDRIYIFDLEGNLLKKNDELITNLFVEYYSLTYLVEYENYVYFSIGFISNQGLYLYGYKYQIEERNIYSLPKLENINTYQIKNNGLSCHFVYYLLNSDYKYLLTCIYHYYNKGFAFDFFTLYTTEIRKNNDISKYTEINDEIKYIRAVLSPDDDESISLGWINADKVPYHWEININQVFNDNKIRFFALSYCKFLPHGFKYNYFREKKEFIYTCIFDSNDWTVPEANILVESLNKTGGQTNYTYKYDNCDVHGYSIIYLDNKHEYYIISDANCSDTLIPFNLLFGNLKEEEILLFILSMSKKKIK